MQIIGNLSELTYLEIVGLISLSYLLIYRPVKFLTQWLINQCQCASGRILRPGPNDYAAITGASDGIGLEYARQLAERGYNLVLLSRTEEKLKRVATEIAAQYPQCKKIEILAVNFAQPDIYASINAKLSGLPGRLHVLVNNVGTANLLPTKFADYPEDFNQRLINTNVVSATEMSRIAIKLMLKQKADSESRSTARGVIINVSSTTGDTECPLYAAYSASKAYVTFLSKIIAAEYASEQIIVQTVTPNQVDTNLSRAAKTPLSVSAKDYVRYALKTVGTESVTNAHPKHKLINNLSLWFGDLIGERLFMKAKMNFALAVLDQHPTNEDGDGRAEVPLVGK